MDQEIKFIDEKVKARSEFVEKINKTMASTIIGQKHIIDRLLIAMLCNGHVLVEGVPGLAKTLIVKTLAAAIDAQFSRIQFTPDLLPSDLIGTMVLNPKTGEFTPRQGQIFANIILADEINRSPSKVQSALLEAMQEHRVSTNAMVSLRRFFGSLKLDHLELETDGEYVATLNRFFKTR